MILDKRADLGHGDVKKLLFSLSVPTITSQIVNMLYNLVDRVFIGHMQPAETVGKLALTGVGVCLPIIMVISAFASLMAIGGAPRASIAEGAGESEKSERIMGNCLTMLLITALQNVRQLMHFLLIFPIQIGIRAVGAIAVAKLQFNRGKPR